MGVAGISVPVRDYTDRVVASLSISGPLARINQANMDRYVDLARQGADQIGALLGHRRNTRLD